MKITKIRFLFLIIFFASIISCSEYHYDVNKKTIRHRCDDADDICEQARKLGSQVESASFDFDRTDENLDLVSLKEKYRWLKEKCRIEQERCNQD